MLERREGWMDSIAFEHELGHALGGNQVFPNVEDLKRHMLCIDRPEQVGDRMVISCHATRVYVFDANEFDKWQREVTEGFLGGVG